MIDYDLEQQVKEDLRRHEGLRLFPYHDTVGKLTIGIGRNLDDVGIREHEAEYLLGTDIFDLKYALSSQLYKRHNYQLTKAPKQVQRALMNMAFQLGIAGLMQFKRMFKALRQGHYAAAATEALDSKWARQVPGRAEEVAGWIRTAGMTGSLMA